MTLTLNSRNVVQTVHEDFVIGLLADCVQKFFPEIAMDVSRVRVSSSDSYVTFSVMTHLNVTHIDPVGYFDSKYSLLAFQDRILGFFEKTYSNVHCLDSDDYETYCCYGYYEFHTVDVEICLWSGHIIITADVTIRQTLL